MSVVEKFTVKKLIPKHPLVQHLLPEKIFVAECTLVLNDVNNAVANALRRTICMELPVKALSVVAENIVCNDEYVIPEMVAERFKMIPIMQSTPVSTKFSLNVRNDTGVIRDVLSGEIKRAGGGELPFEAQFTLFTLNPGSSAEIAHISIIEEYGYMPKCGMMVLASGCVSKPLDVVPIDLKTRIGESSSMANPRKWQISFTAHGTMPEHDIVVAACNNIVARIESVKEITSQIQSNGNEHILNVPGETDTIGNLFMRTVLDLHPTGVSILYLVDNSTHSVDLKMVCAGDAATIIHNTADEMVEIFKAIAGGVKKSKGV